jgi:hypothetical protein
MITNSAREPAELDRERTQPAIMATPAPRNADGTRVRRSRVR